MADPLVQPRKENATINSISAMQINPAQLRAICLKMPEPRSEVLATIISELAAGYGIDTRSKLAMFIAQVAHESAEFTAKEENLHYSAMRLRQVWPTRFSMADAARCAGNGVLVANHAYANRMGNGPDISGDGFRFRGGGFIQITGRDMYTRFARYRAIDVMTAAELVRTEDRWAIDSALWAFCIEKGLLKLAEAGDVKKVTEAINGGTLGLAQRVAYYRRALAALGAV